MVAELVVGLLLGLLPTRQVAKPDVVDALKDSSRGTSGGRGQGRTRTALMVGEVAVSIVLLAVAGLLVASFMRLQGVDPRFRPSGILIAGVQPPAERYPDRSEALVQFYTRLLDRAREIPIIVNGTLVRQAFPDRDPIGQ